MSGSSEPETLPSTSRKRREGEGAHLPPSVAAELRREIQEGLLARVPPIKIIRPLAEKYGITPRAVWAHYSKVWRAWEESQSKFFHREQMRVPRRLDRLSGIYTTEHPAVALAAEITLGKIVGVVPTGSVQVAQGIVFPPGTTREGLPGSEEARRYREAVAMLRSMEPASRRALLLQALPPPEENRDVAGNGEPKAEPNGEP
jgi:hypothetical protein